MKWKPEDYEGWKRRKAILEARIDTYEAQKRKQQRIIDTRRKVFLGGAVLAEAEAVPEVRRQLVEILTRRLTRPQEIELFFYLSEEPEEKAAVTETKPDTPTSRLEVLKQRKAKLEAEIARMEKGERARQRSQETRRKILVGAAVLAEMEAEPSLKGVIQDILKRRLTQARDRALLADLLNGQ
jgi:hypothetical protein